VGAGRRGGVMHVDQTLTLIEKTVFLKTMPEAASIPTEALAEIAARAEEIHLDPGDVLYHEGDPDRGFFVVIDGSLELRKGRAMVRVVTSGMAIGELWRGVDEPHQYTLTATEQSHVLNVARDDVMEAMVDFPEFAVVMVRYFALRVHELTVRVLDLEDTVAKLHRALTAAGIEPPDPRNS